jgi:hypothetical protein
MTSASPTGNAVVVSASSTPAVAASGMTWDSTIGPLFTQKCLMCHGAAATGGLNLSTFADAMKGGASGAIIIPGDAANSLIITKFEGNKHPSATLPPDELTQIKTWIDAGALEK